MILPRQLQNQSPQSRRAFAAIVLLRSLFALLLIELVDLIADFGTSATAVGLGAVCGTAIGSWLSFTSLRTRGFLIIGVILAGLCRALLILLSSIAWLKPYTVFQPYMWADHISLIAAVIFVAALFNWLFWRFQLTLSIEILLVAAAGIIFFAGHRNFQFDSLKIINNLAWRLNIDLLSFLVFAGLTLSLLIFLYIWIAVLPGRPVPRRSAPKREIWRGKHSVAAAAAAGVVAAAVLFFIAKSVYQHFEAESLSRTAHGVGQATESGATPLGFHSALGGSNEPAALARLDGDYPENPFTPMLYLRESALSKFNGREIVIAAAGFDDDVAASVPHQEYTRAEDARLLYRTPVVQSIYLLSDHKNSFAVDYPINMQPLKNPNPGRFKGAYRAYSAAPAFSIREMLSLPVGDPSWDTDQRNHYLEQHTDPRYREMAQSIVNEGGTALEQALAVTDFLNRRAIYTLRPGHEVASGEDPTAPFLFGDLRGYCVHFAHATVYMLRALGIPSRIATGYLTDLSQSRDGHILLRLSDRHAWAEVFVQERGWVPFDVQPENVESHADSPVDMKLLEELMGMIGLDDEILPDRLLEGELPQRSYGEWNMPIPDLQTILLTMLAMAVILILFKVYLRLGWLLPGSQAKRIIRGWRAVASSLYDAGIRRQEGETRGEFRRRLSTELGDDALSLAAPLTTAAYAREGAARIPALHIVECVRSDLRTLKRRLSRGAKIRTALNPSSVLFWISRRGW